MNVQVTRLRYYDHSCGVTIMVHNLNHNNGTVLTLLNLINRRHIPIITVEISSETIGNGEEDEKKKIRKQTWSVYHYIICI